MFGIKSTKVTIAILLLGIAIVLLVIRYIASVNAPVQFTADVVKDTQEATSTAPVASKYKIIPLTMSGIEFKAEVADTNELRNLGLSNRKSLDIKQAMLFVFDEPGRHSFWMKDMNFAIDMIWLDQDGRVVTIAHDAKPESYPNSFAPEGDSLYVVEVVSGISDELGIKKGDQIIFDKNMLKKTSN